MMSDKEFTMDDKKDNKKSSKKPRNTLNKRRNEMGDSRSQGAATSKPEVVKDIPEEIGRHGSDPEKDLNPEE
jgi:hypothetical protein